jgi:hypothetical protein
VIEQGQDDPQRRKIKKQFRLQGAITRCKRKWESNAPTWKSFPLTSTNDPWFDTRTLLDLLQRAEITQGTGPLAESKTLDLSTWNIIDWLHDTGRRKENEVRKIDLLIETQPTEGFDLEWKEKSKRLVHEE